MKKNLYLLNLLLLFIGNSYAYEYLNLVHVDYWGWSEPGYIDSATILVEPHGLYAKCELLIDFSIGYAYFEEWENMEVEMEFTLPAESHITDLYLWIEGEPVQAFIFDTWTASLIYESIVQRRIDPAILTKTWWNTYNLKVYPITYELPRRIKMEFITPINNVMGSMQSVSLPLNILKLSNETPKNARIAFKENGIYNHPSLLEDTDVTFDLVSDPNFDVCKVGIISDVSEMNNGTLLFTQKNPADNIYAATYESDKTKEKYLELALNQSELIGISAHRKAIFMLDFLDANCSQYAKEELVESLKFSILNTYSNLDSFNILVSGLTTNYLSDYWIEANPASIECYFNGFDDSLINDYSNLPTLLMDGVNFLKNNGQTGSLILVASSNSYGSSVQANSLITDYLGSLSGIETSLHVIDLDDTYYYSNERHTIGGQTYLGNEYLYSRLTQLTSGEYYSVRTYSLASMLSQVSDKVSGYFKSLELFIQTDGGYTYANYRLNHSSGLVYNNQPIQLIGKYVGEAPFYISIFGQSSTNEIFHYENTLLAKDINEGDSLIEKCWSANYMQELISYEQSNQMVNQIIDYSIGKRILSNYTAFLVLEPDFEIPDEIEEQQEFEDDIWPLTRIEKITEQSSVKLSCYPNPFSIFTYISYSVMESSTVNLSIYNTVGKLIEILVNKKLNQGEYTYELEVGNYQEGIYFCILQVNGETVAKLKMVVI